MSDTSKQGKPGRTSDADWLAGSLDYLRGLKYPSAQQKRLVELADEGRTPDKDRLMRAIINAERAREDAAHLLRSQNKKIKDEARKQRTHRLILQGQLFDQAGLQDWSKGEMLGMLLANANASDDQRATWKRQGDAELAAAEKRKKAKPAKTPENLF